MQSLEATSASRLSTIYRQISAEGKIRFFRGIFSVILGAGPSHAVYFATYEKAKSILVNNDSSTRHLASGLSGALATTLSDAFMNPFDVVKQRMQVQSSRFGSIFQCEYPISGHPISRVRSSI